MKHVITFFLLVLSSGLRASEVTVEQVATLPRADVILLGEVHDNPVHHQNQAAIIRAIAPSAIVFEMLTPRQVSAAKAADRAKADELAEALSWKGSGWPDFALYYPIFKAAGSAPFYGGNLPKGQARRAVTEGAAPVFGDEAARYGLTTPLAAREQEERELGQMKAHCNALPETLLPGMVQAQRLRDAALAAAVIKAKSETGGPVVVITGNGHARKDWGVPSILKFTAPELAVTSVGQFEETANPEMPFDFHLITKAWKREDPCARFQKPENE